ncbi:MAG: Mrp/NBP35 family ATP-binding protein [Dysgonamonadaceae bacterium]|jgi:ATP-binding protein involved in chromosome partitioning|nr:Mrp/NBP35 family ATP-binding protein [Dysgonamonadaceae bacterium]
MILNEQSVLSALEKVRYPGKKQNIVELGMVGDLAVDGRKVTFSLTFEKSSDPFIKSLVKSAESTILAFLGEDIDIKGNITVKANQSPRPEADKLLPEVKNIIAVYSGKGGVGKSTVAVNLAVALAQAGYKTGLLDADIFGPSIPKMLATEDAHPYMETIGGRQLIVPAQKYGLKMLSIGYFVGKDDALVWRGTMASNALRQLIADADWGELDYFIIDMPPGTSDIHLTLVQTLAVTGAVIVTTPQEVALADARKGIAMFTCEKINVPVLGLVENMSWFTPAELPDNKYFIFGKGGGEKLSESLGIPLLGQIPIVQSICESCETGVPAALGETVTGEAFRQLAQKIVESVEERNLKRAATKRVETSR